MMARILFIYFSLISENIQMDAVKKVDVLKSTEALNDQEIELRTKESHELACEVMQRVMANTTKLYVQMNEHTHMSIADSEETAETPISTVQIRKDCSPSGEKPL